ncbi:futalosine hydrolase [Streptomyces sp. SID3343]|uniref:futalosine hydrolase n=1 Tax=Streptomyces sp. SID3343 TaxID=2690260 RepID=UPI00136B9FE7|nr:futalosine hydrolase [Streptomyces sp. SID3343]MYW00950.1 futalosine hydrolase [Streptomyces sp. SID3343]
MRVLVITAVSAERDAVLGGTRSWRTPAVDAVAVGVGPAAAAAGTAAALARDPYDLVLSAGIGGGFAGVAPVGSTVLATRIVAADLGAETADGFVPIEELGFGTGAFEADPDRLAHAGDALRAADIPLTVGPALTVSTVTGTAARAALLSERHPGAAVEGMEGFGVATAAAAFGVPVLELRTISNAVGPRDRAAWRIPAALAALTTAFAALEGSLTR